jgi:hypothetical protein
MASSAALLKLPLEDSVAAARPLPRPLPWRHPCAACGARPARFQYRGVVKADRRHTLCFQCYRAAVNRVRLALTTLEPAAAGAAVPASPVPRPRGTPDGAGAETAKYDQLARRRRHAQIAARHALGGEEVCAGALHKVS